MARRSHLLSDSAYLLEYMQDLTVESDSDGEFDSYLGPDDRRSFSVRDEQATTPKLISDENTGLDEAASYSESPLARTSPSHSPMQGESSSGSPLVQRGSPTHRSTALAATASASEVKFLLE